MKKLILMFPLVFIIIYSSAQAPPLSWAKAVVDKRASYPQCDLTEIETDDLGQVYISGYFEDTLILDQNQPSNYLIGVDENGYFAKYDASGNLLWGKCLLWTKIRDLCLDRYGNIFITGRFYDATTVDFDPGPGTASITVSSGALFFAKYDANGNYIWAKVLTLFNAAENASNVIVVDSNSNIYLGGQFRYTLDLDPGPGVYDINNPGTTYQCPACPIGFYAKYDSTGAFLWGYRDLTCNYVLDIAVNNSNGDIAVAADVGTPFRYVLANGTTTHYTSGGTYQHGAYSAMFDRYGNVYFSGSFGGTSADLDWGTGSTTLTTTGITDQQHIIVKYDSNQVFQWANLYEIDGGPSTHSWKFEVKLSSDDDFQAAYRIVSSGVTVSGFAKFSNSINGPLLWNNPFVWAGNGYANLADIAVCHAEGSFCFASNLGYSNTPTSVDADLDTSVYTVTGNGRFGFMAKYGNCTAVPLIAGMINGTDSICSGSSATYSINPVSGATSYTWTLPAGWIGSSTTNSISMQNNGSSGTISVTANNSCGNSIAQSLAVTVNNATSNVISPSACDSYQLNGQTYTSSGAFTQHLTNSQGCDSTITINLTIKNNSTSAISPIACDSYTSPNGSVYTASGNYTNIIPNHAGCDSVISINLTINTVDVSVSVNDPVITANASGALYQWLDCNNSMAVIPAATNQSFTALANGRYAVEVIENGCADTSACVDIYTVGLPENNKLERIEIYPNPAQDQITLQVNADFLGASYILNDLLGRTVLAGQFHSELTAIDIGLLANGVYLLKIGGQFQQSFKVMKK